MTVTKPAPVEEIEKNVTEVVKVKEIAVTSAEPSKSKKKRKKDKNAGLLYTLKKTYDNNAKTMVNLCQQTQTMNIQKKPNVSQSSIQSIINKSINQATNKNKSKPNKGQQPKNLKQPPPKRNALLHLAKALKANNDKSSSNLTNDKLKKMFR